MPAKGKAPIRFVERTRDATRAAGALITPALFSQPPPIRREKREKFVEDSRRLPLVQRQQRAAAAVDDLQRRRDEHRSGRGELAEVPQARETEFAGAVHQGVSGEGWIEGAGLARVWPRGAGHE